MATLHPGDRVKSILDRRKSLMTGQSNWRNRWQDVSDYIMPGRADITSKRSPGSATAEKIFDATAPTSAAIAAAAAQGSMMPSTVKWFAAKLIESFERLPGVTDWLFDISTIGFRAFNNSNFHAESTEVWMDLLSYGTGCMFSEWTPSRGMLYTAIQPGTYAIDENHEGLVDTIFRDFARSADSLVAMFGFDALNDKVQAKIKAGKGHEKIMLTHAVFPRNETVDAIRGLPQLRLAKDMPYASFIIDVHNKHVLSESGYEEFPFFVPRWSKASGEMYGRGPGLTMMPDIRTLNQAVAMRLEQWALVIRPPMLALERAIKGKLALVPGHINYVSDMNGLRELISEARFDVASFNENEIRLRIEKGFFIDQIQFPPLEGTPASATEIATRAEFMQRILGPVYNRVEFEWQLPMLARHLAELNRNGQLPPMPPALELALEQANVPDLEFNFEGPLARAQVSSDVDATNKALGSISALEEVHPDVALRVNYEELGHFYLTSNRVPAKIILDDAEVARVKEERAQQDAAAQQEQSALTASEGLKNVTPFLTAAEGGEL